MRLPILLAATLACSALPAYAETIFPSDGEKPTLPKDRELLKIVCPSGAAFGDKSVTCPVPCPAFTGLPGETFEWSMESVTRGHFLSRVSEDAVVFTSGCEPQTLNSGGTFLLTRNYEGFMKHAKLSQGRAVIG